MPRTPEQEALKKKWAKINSVIADQANLTLFGNFLFQNELVPQQTVTSTLKMNGIDDLDKVGRLMGVVQSRITTANTPENAARYYNKFVLLVHDDLHLTDLAMEMEVTCRKCYAEVNLPYSSPLAQGTSAVAHQATGAGQTGEPMYTPEPRVSESKSSLLWSNKITQESVRFLELLKYYDSRINKEEELHIIKELALFWAMVAEIMGFKPSQIRSIGRLGSGKPAEMCMRDIFLEWIQNGGSQKYKCTWDGLHSLLQDCLNVKLARKLHDAIESDQSNLRDASVERSDQPTPGQQSQPKSSGRHKKMNKDALAEWLGNMGVDDNDVKMLQGEGVNENLFLDMKEGDEYARKLTKATLKQLPMLKEKLKNM